MGEVVSCPCGAPNRDNLKQISIEDETVSLYGTVYNRSSVEDNYTANLNDSTEAKTPSNNLPEVETVLPSQPQEFKESKSIVERTVEKNIGTITDVNKFADETEDMEEMMLKYKDELGSDRFNKILNGPDSQIFPPSDLKTPNINVNINQNN